MTVETLKQEIAARYPSKRSRKDFIEAFNKKVGFSALSESALSRQIRARVNLTAGWQAAYTLFFQTTPQGRKI